MFPVLQIGPLALQTPGLLILIGIWLGLSASERLASRFKIESNQLYNLVLVSLVAGILGARLAFAIQYSSIFISDPLAIFSFTLTMFNGEAGLVIGIIAGFIYAQRKSLKLWPTLDALTPALSVFMIFLHISDLASGNAFGSPVNMPFAIELWGQYRHPVQIYEMVAAIGIAFVLIHRISIKSPISEMHPDLHKAGLYFWMFVALTALARLFFEFFRGDSTTIPGNIHVAQVFAWAILAVSLWQLNKHQKIGHEISASQVKDVDHVS
jgi:phosphatidylglycerol:prolipoprotein diacylglycerol transferase